ncbi:DUF2332 domain-containing protein [Desulfobulbus rhabdoformis]|uniref:DUF2332 domain-containing protein n=1 Tax=Desulfobulbus rhabdoformis TaxID=34032 RepID=UPI001965C9C3|nr:DUF2332 domain-containing protein [Desulfobulbus rhabdoformis]MBM9614980.1 DUF2332 domain-containing protein [Desulfobulbus rhabdoformis]
MNKPQDKRLRLARRFRKQQTFSQKSSPLSAFICGLVADLLSPESQDEEIASWLLTASEGQTSFAVPMLLLASIHYEILRGNPVFSRLARYYPTVGGYREIEPDIFVTELYRVLRAQQEILGEFIASSSVQTNETSRGVCWVLPLSYVHWAEVALVDLGCSAGLNLIAEKRRYALHELDGNQRLKVFGYGQSPEFSVVSEGEVFMPVQTQLPKISARIGCDLHPFLLHNPSDEIRLASFVWGDQPERLDRLQEAINAFHVVAQTQNPVQLFGAKLPDELSSFLYSSLPKPTTPVVVYNTYLRPYIREGWESIEYSLKEWSKNHEQPLLWLQWELAPNGVQGPQLGWLAWTAELVENGQSRKWLLGWVHPHGGHVQWEKGMRGWNDFWTKEKGKVEKKKIVSGLMQDRTGV